MRAAGAEAPNRSIPTEPPPPPRYRSHPKVAAAPTETLARTDDGSRDWRYRSGCSSNRSQQRKLTTREDIPSVSRSLAAPRATCTSEPEANRITAGWPFPPSLRMYAPRYTFPSRNTSSGGRIGTLCRVSAIAEGPVDRSIAIFHAAAVSLASAGRKTYRFGIALSDGRCSIGWGGGGGPPGPPGSGGGGGGH